MGPLSNQLYKQVLTARGSFASRRRRRPCPRCRCRVAVALLFATITDHTHKTKVVFVRRQQIARCVNKIQLITDHYEYTDVMQMTLHFL